MMVVLLFYLQGIRPNRNNGINLSSFIKIEKNAIAAIRAIIDIKLIVELTINNQKLIIIKQSHLLSPPISLLFLMLLLMWL